MSKPPLYDLVNDFEIIYPEYEKNFDNNFWNDYSNLDINLFNLKISSLENNFSHLVKARDILINNRKVDKQERKWAEQFMTPQIMEWRKDKQDKANKNKIAMELSGLELSISKILKERQEKNDKRL